MKRLLKRFKELPDYRKYKIAKYNVGEVIYVSLLAMLAGANGYEDMALWIKIRLMWGTVINSVSTPNL